MPLVFQDSVSTVLSSLPFQSRSQQASGDCLASRPKFCAFCSATQSPSGATATALGKPGGALNSGLVLTLRWGRSFFGGSGGTCAKLMLAARPNPAERKPLLLR